MVAEAELYAAQPEWLSLNLVALTAFAAVVACTVLRRPETEEACVGDVAFGASVSDRAPSAAHLLLRRDSLMGCRRYPVHLSSSQSIFLGHSNDLGEKMRRRAEQTAAIAAAELDRVDLGSAVESERAARLLRQLLLIALQLLGLWSLNAAGVGLVAKTALPVLGPLAP